MRILISLLLLHASWIHAGEVSVQSRVDKVVVYKDRAFVTRSMNKNLKKGSHSLVLKSLPVGLQVDSLKVKTFGNAKLRVLGVRAKKIEIKQTDNDKLQKLIKDQRKTRDTKNALIQQIQKIISQHQHLKDVQNYYRKTFSYNLQTGKWSAKSFRQFMDYSKSKREGFVKKWDKEYQKLLSVFKKLDYLNNKISELNSRGVTTTMNVMIDLETTQTGKYAVSLQYLVFNAGWKPVYDIRVDEKSKKAKLEQYAFIWQSTGEDWNKVSIELSNIRSKLQTTPPSIHSYTLRYQKVEKVKTTISSKMDNAASLKAMAAMDTVAMDKSLEVNFKIAKKQTIKTGFPQSRVFIKSASFPYQEHLEVVASRFGYAYRKGELVNKLPWTLHPGQASIYYNGDFIQSFWLEKTPKKQKFYINAGIDYDIKVSHWHHDKKKDAGMLNSKKVFRRKFTTQLMNYAGGAKKVKVLAQYPVSETEQIKVSTKGSSKGFKKLKDFPSWGAWDVSVPSMKKKSLDLNVKVEVPEDFNFNWN
jgi:uncharacterized protein (TIGR02231 family)